MEDRKARCAIWSNMRSAARLLRFAGENRRADAGAGADDGQRIAAHRALQRRYFWISDYHPDLDQHPIKPEAAGRDMTDNKDRPANNSTSSSSRR